MQILLSTRKSIFEHFFVIDFFQFYEFILINLINHSTKYLLIKKSNIYWFFEESAIYLFAFNAAGIRWRIQDS